MDTTLVIVIALFALIVVAAFLVFRSRGKVEIKGPLGTGLNLDASNEPQSQQPAVLVEDAASRRGGILAEDGTGRGAAVRRVDVQDDIIAASSQPERRDPKA